MKPAALTNFQTQGIAYLSGGMQFAENLGAGWRASLTKTLRSLGYHAIDPTLIETSYQAKYNVVSPGTATTSGEMQREDKVRIGFDFIHADYTLIQMADFVVLFYDRSVQLGAGTITEAGWSYDQSIPLFIVLDEGMSYDTMPAWLAAEAARVFVSFDQLAEYLARVPENAFTDCLICTMCGTYESDLCSIDHLCKECGSVFTKKLQHDQTLPSRAAFAISVLEAQ